MTETSIPKCLFFKVILLLVYVFDDLKIVKNLHLRLEPIVGINAQASSLKI